MIKNIIKDIDKLSKKSIPATKEDLYIIEDLQDTININKDKCIGMAANMIGYNKTILIVSYGLFNLVMINPKIVTRKDKYLTKESCLSLNGERETTRYNYIELEYFDKEFNMKKGTYTGIISEIIQHEIDHFNGIII